MLYRIFESHNKPGFPLKRIKCTMKASRRAFLISLVLDVLFIIPNIVSLVIKLFKGNIPVKAGIFGLILFVLLVIVNHVLMSLSVQNKELKRKVEELSKTGDTQESIKE